MKDHGTELSRRRLLAGVGAGAAVATLGPFAEPAYADGAGVGWLVPRNRIGIQLYTVRDLLAADPAGTWRQIAAIGSRNIELAGLAGSPRLSSACSSRRLENAGRNAIRFFNRCERRAPLIHVKDRNPGPPVPPYGSAPNTGPGIPDAGAGAIDFRRIFESRERPNQKEYIVERDTQVHPVGHADGRRRCTRRRSRRPDDRRS